MRVCGLSFTTKVTPNTCGVQDRSRDARLPVLGLQSLRIGPPPVNRLAPLRGFPGGAELWRLSGWRGIRLVEIAKDTLR